MTIGALGFLNPLLLGALALLPVLYWLLRTVPPRPRQLAFPPTRMLKDLENREQTPARTPWWLMLIRMAAAALVIFALAEPVLNPKRTGPLAGSGPLVIVVDNDWAAAARWPLRTDMMAALIAEAESGSRAVVIAATASATRGGLKLEPPKAARETAAAIRPEPWAPRRMETLSEIEKALGQSKPGRIVWLADGLDHGQDAAFAQGLAKLAGGAAALTLVAPGEGEEPLGLTSRMGQAGRLIADVRRAEGSERAGLVQAWSARGQRLGEVPFRLGNGAKSAEVTFDMPLELRNQVARIDIAALPSAGAVSLLDSRSRWHRVGLIASTAREKDQPLLSPLYYVNKALSPFAELSVPKAVDVPAAFEAVLAENASVAMLADVGKLVGTTHEKADDWVRKGGVLVRFAGPRLEKGADDLLPVPLRLGGRTLGGALSWSTPQPLGAFDADSLFAGLPVPAEVQVSRQVLADPARLGDANVKVWARLKDGTPLVTAARHGDGWLVLFHVTANSDWSNLPLSGLFVEMLRRVVTLTGITGAPGRVAGDTSQGASVQASSAEVLAPVETLNGFGELKSPPPTAQAIQASRIGELVPSPENPPGLYGPAASARALNLIGPKTVLKPLPSLPSGATHAVYQSEKSRPLKPELLALALGLLFTDIIAVILLQTGLAWRRAPAAAAALALGAALLAALFSGGAEAQSQPQPGLQPPPGAGPAPVRGLGDEFALRAAIKTRLAYVRTGDEATDRVSRLGLNGLNSVLIARTAVEPAEPVGLDVETDELAFFPILYWPVIVAARPLSDKTLAKIDAYMKTGGLIIFDTRDYAQAMPTPSGLQGPGSQALQRLIGKLDVPRLEPVPDGHVLTKSFYLLKSFPGRWDSAQTWVEAGTEGDKEDTRKARRADGVSSIIITANDLASAWATDERGRYMFPVVPGGEHQREMSLRTGVNIVMYALTGNYKADQVHVPALLERLGQ